LSVGRALLRRRDANKLHVYLSQTWKRKIFLNIIHVQLGILSDSINDVFHSSYKHEVLMSQVELSCDENESEEV
jgi:hypothetical protein